MCLALTGRVVAIGEGSAASLPGVIELPQGRREVELIMTPEVEVGDYVVIHSGYAIRVVPDSELGQRHWLVGEND